ncbi:MAG TPA: 30S ribosomal protein S8 [Ktedonobacteraceae bacterium]
MNMTDPIADMLTRIRNAVTARHARVSIPASKMKLAIARVLKEEGYIKDIEILKDTPQGTLRLTLRYVEKKSVLTQLKRVSKPGLRVYTRRGSIPRVRGGQGISILSTPQGLMTGRKAYQEGLGGEVVCYVW